MPVTEKTGCILYRTVTITNFSYIMTARFNSPIKIPRRNVHFCRDIEQTIKNDVDESKRRYRLFSEYTSMFHV